MEKVQHIWSSFLQKYGDTVQTRVLIPWCIMMIFFWIYGILMMLLDIRHKPTWAYSKKFQPERPFVLNGSSYSAPLFKVVKLVIFNQFFVILPGLLLMDFLSRQEWFFFCNGIRMEDDLPSFLDVVSSAVLSVLYVEVAFYFSHRWLHSKEMYARVHKIHHEMKAPYAIAAIYAHPFEALVGNTFAVMGAAFFCNVHGLLWYIGMVLGWFDTMSAHSGYGLFHHRFHDLHHELFNCNFGATGLLDAMLRTSNKYFKSSSGKKSVR
eukprot:Lithocolla_globosa_v1_NODE_4618_length_1398_cov_15.274554.p1 type:complete len:265 gc:universal NODE_4618_length_1398_cov_15.274554:142-936(+)